MVTGKNSANIPLVKWHAVIFWMAQVRKGILRKGDLSCFVNKLAEAKCCISPMKASWHSSFHSKCFVLRTVHL